MTTFIPTRTPLTGILCAIAASAMFSINDVIFKFLSGSYALHEMVLIRTVVGLIVMLAVILPLSGGWRLIRTPKWRQHVIRGGFVVISNSFYFLALARLQLADAVAIFYVAPLMVTALSVPVLGERVGPRRWIAVLIGLSGVIVMIRPGSASFQIAALFPVASAFCYALMHMMTRRMGGTESALTMTVYVQIAFLVVSALMGLAFGSGWFARPDGDPLAFLFRPWVWPPAVDWPLLILVGFTGTVGGILIAQAYKLGEAGLVAPFEYAAMPMAIFWGALIFSTWPDPVAWIGIALICGAGVYIAVREAQLGRRRAIAAKSGDL
jgi:drug/metabolite transporter (DMT)-like permease